MANPKPRRRGRPQAEPEPAPAPKGLPPLKWVPERSVSPLRRYIRRYDLPVPSPMTFQGFLLGGPAGAHSQTVLRSDIHKRRVPRKIVADAMTEHLQSGMIREADAIAEFVYTVQTSEREFKLRLGDTPRDKEPLFEQ